MTLVGEGRLSEPVLRELRLRYNTEEPDYIPSEHWSQAQ